LLEILFDNNFLALGIDLQTELISDANANKTAVIHGSDRHYTPYNWYIPSCRQWFYLKERTSYIKERIEKNIVLRQCAGAE
jgi:hypothetical protein